MRQIKSVTIGEEELVVRELTVAEIRGLLDRAETGGADDGLFVINLLFPKRLPAEALAISLGMTGAEMAAKNWAPSALERVIEAAESVNPTFASLLARLADVGREALKTSTGPAAG
jgi:hypothetical protein